MKIKSYISGAKWFGIKEALFEFAGQMNVNISFTDEDRGFIRTTIFYEIEGKEEDVKNFEKRIKEAVERFNNN